MNDELFTEMFHLMRSMNDRLIHVESDVTEFKQEMTEFKQEMTEFKQEMTEFKQEMTKEIIEIRHEITDLKSDMDNLHQEVDGLRQKLTDLDLMIENDVKRDIHILAENHLNVIDRVNAAVPLLNKQDMHDVQIRYVINKVDQLEREVKLLQSA